MCSLTQATALNTNVIHLKLDAVCARSRAHGCAHFQQQQAIPMQSHGHSHTHVHEHTCRLSRQRYGVDGCTNGRATFFVWVLARHKHTT